MIYRFCIGSFFAASGYNKLFTFKGNEVMAATIHEAGIPFPDIMWQLVASVECFGGLLLMIGFLARINALAFLSISLVALLTVGIHQIPINSDFITWYSWLFYLPEPLYVLILMPILVLGAGWLSVDQLLCQRYGKNKKDYFFHIR
ncbi:DoxX family protein [Neisseria sp. Ec49-e6-T10]|uniref:DoxX family protein n=1 Tax=Neisseria sp. Ec49-e6-T10 TaxID=3140744 RepID=UPI003EBDF99A